MSRSINRARPERDVVKRSRYGRFDTHRERRARLSTLKIRDRRRTRSLSIRVVDAHPYAHHPVGLADIRAMLARLPDMSVNTLGEILLTRGDEADLHPDPEASASSDVCDVWIKRQGDETLPGIFFGRTLGTYHPRTASIHLNSVVYEPGYFTAARWQALLRLRMLETLVHEVGHHRWSCDR